MKKLLLLGIAAVALTAAVPAQAQLSLTGECGLARTMNASVLPPMTLAVAADYVGSEDTFIPLRAEFGVIDGLEIGANYWFMDTEGLDNIFGFNAKYKLPLQAVEGLGVAVGANYQIWSFDEEDVKQLKLTAVASYDIPAGPITVTPSVGVIWERVEQGDWDDNGFRFFASAVAMVMPNLGIGGEFITRDDDLDVEGKDSDASMWFGARYMAMDNLAVQAGLINNANIGDDFSDWVFHVGAQYSFNFAK